MSYQPISSYGGVKAPKSDISEKQIHCGIDKVHVDTGILSCMSALHRLTGARAYAWNGVSAPFVRFLPPLRGPRAPLACLQSSPWHKIGLIGHIPLYGPMEGCLYGTVWGQRRTYGHILGAFKIF